MCNDVLVAMDTILLRVSMAQYVGAVISTRVCVCVCVCVCEREREQEGETYQSSK